MIYDIVYGEHALDRLFDVAQELNAPTLLDIVEEAMGRLASDPVHHGVRGRALYQLPDGKVFRPQYFGSDRLLTEITAGDCDDWKAHQEAKGHAPATIGRNVKRARQYFQGAVRKRLLAENPMQDVKAPAQVNTARAFYVSCEVTERIIAAAPDAEWRLIVALARYGGLRTPSKTFALTWADVNWA